MLTCWLVHCYKRLCWSTLPRDICSNKWYTRARLLLRRGVPCVSGQRAQRRQGHHVQRPPQLRGRRAGIYLKHVVMSICSHMLIAVATSCCAATWWLLTLLICCCAVCRHRRQRPAVLQLH